MGRNLKGKKVTRGWDKEPKSNLKVFPSHRAHLPKDEKAAKSLLFTLERTLLQLKEWLLGAGVH